MRSADLIKMLEAQGWELKRVNGSHHQFRHPESPNVVTVPHPKSELSKGTLNSILKTAGLKK
ncbi:MULTISPECIES: type II toxin-antitoxin system HicA family toxin [Serratia]|uniref:type II toxin-antitoxin system HicA family toxin n=1 Tax=Serratia TaxID=613 RepID=UPI000949AAB9|nr:type II toxin-antitoxin system HicA family toxin [Serratia sp. 506_PEND]